MDETARPFAPIISLAIGILLSITILAVTICSPATIPIWCTAHGGCP